MSARARLEILTCDVPELVAALRAGCFRREGLRVTTAYDARELAERAAVIRPDIIIVVADLPKPRADSVALELRALLAGNGSLLLLAMPRDCEAIDDDLLGYDAILLLEDPETISRALASLTTLVQRRQRRHRVAVLAEILTEEGPGVDAVTVDFSAMGAGLEAARRPDGDTYFLRFFRSDGRSVLMGARTVWSRPASGSHVRLGVRFINATLDRVRALFDLAFWEMVDVDGRRMIHLHGEISESSSFAAVLRRVATAPIIDLGDIARIDSAGVRRWKDFLQRVPGELRLVLRRISVPVAREMLLTPALADGCAIESFYAPYECLECDLEVPILAFPDHILVPPTCVYCGRAMKLTEPILGIAAEQSSLPATKH